MEWLHVIECEDEDEDEDDSDGPNSDRILGSVSLKANCYDSESTKPPHGGLAVKYLMVL